MNDLSSPRTVRVSAEEALALHATGRPGKLETRITKPLTTARDLSLAYSPGVAEPCLQIAPRSGARLRLHDQGQHGRRDLQRHRRARPRQSRRARRQAGDGRQGRAVQALRRRRRHRPLQSTPRTSTQFVNCVRYLGPSFGGINLEDIKAPECFIIEQRLRELMDIPVFHDDQHGTAIVAAAGLINACHLTGRDLRDTKLVVNGAGAAAIACVELLKAMGMRARERHPVRHQGRGLPGPHRGHEPVEVRARGRDQGAHADRRDGGRRRVLRPVGQGRADRRTWCGAMADKPIIFAMANPDPEITPEEARAASPHAIIATGRSDYPNQVNNVLGFPYIFRGALDVRAQHDQRGDEDRRRRGAGRSSRARTCPTRSAPPAPGSRLQFGPGIHHPERRSIRA